LGTASINQEEKNTEETESKNGEEGGGRRKSSALKNSKGWGEGRTKNIAQARTCLTRRRRTYGLTENKKTGGSLRHIKKRIKKEWSRIKDGTSKRTKQDGQQSKKSLEKKDRTTTEQGGGGSKNFLTVWEKP